MAKLSAKDQHEIGLYRQTGRQDCGNTISISDFDFDIPGATAEEIVEAFDLENNYDMESWLEQNEDVPLHIQKECYEAWLDGWNSCARGVIAEELRMRRKHHDLYFLMTGGVDWEGRHTGGDIIEKFDDFDEAMTALAGMGDRREKATLFEGNALDGPETMVAYIGLGFYPIGRAGRELDVKEWREKYRDPVVKKPIKTNPIDDGEVFWLVDQWPVTQTDLHEHLIEKFDYLEDALNELVKLPYEVRPAVLVGTADRLEAWSRGGSMVAYRSRIDGHIHAGNHRFENKVFAWKERAGMSPTRSFKNVKTNPTEDTKRAAVGKYKEFWRQEPTKIGEFPSSFKIPARVHKLGRAVNVLYESKKTDPETLKKPKKPLAYIHEHDSGVYIHDLHGEKDTETPDFIKHAQALVCLGQCLGFAWWDEEGDEHEAEGTGPLPDLWCTVDGRALLVIQSRRTVLQIVWGGGLGVEARGIVG